MKKLMLASITFFSMNGMMAHNVWCESAVVDCEASKDWQTLNCVEWQQLKRSEQNVKDAAHAATVLLGKLGIFENELDAWHKNVFNVNSYPNPNTIEDVNEKNELLQRIANDSNAIINRAKQGYKLHDDLSSMMKFGNKINRGITDLLRYLLKNMGEKVQAFNKYNSTKTTSSQKDSAHAVLVRDFDYQETISKIKSILESKISEFKKA